MYITFVVNCTFKATNIQCNGCSSSLEAQIFCKNDSDSSFESLILTPVVSEAPRIVTRAMLSLAQSYILHINTLSKLMVRASGLH